MGIINVLSFEVANLIAAGEVVDRPASVIKELVENSIDSGATRVTVEIQRGGVTFMRVTDNGCGIAPEDLPVAVRRHATSKIKNASDLDGIATLGFRGEALAAICAVSDVRIISKMPGAVMGACIEVNSGRVGSVVEQGASDGTTVIVENLFANVPARLKFLKRDLTEAVAVTSVVEKISLSHPEVAFRLISDGAVKLETSGDGKLYGAVRSIWGRDFASKMLAVELESEGVHVSGFITSPEAPRANRNYQNFFINGRYIKTRTGSAALEQAYTSYIPPEKFPGCVISITIAPNVVDVNVHPTKLEVKFSNERPVFDCIYAAVRSALLTNVVRPGQEGSAIPAPPPRAGSMTGAFVPLNDRSAGAGKNRQLDIADMSRENALQAQGKTQIHSGVKPASVPAAQTVSRQNDFWQHITVGVPEEKKKEPANPAPTAQKNETVFVPTVSAPKEKPADVPYSAVPVSLRGGEMPLPTPTDADAPPPPEAQYNPVPTAGETPLVSGSRAEWRIVGELFNSYIIIERGGKDTALMIDKHAAHERLIFEQLRRNMKNDERSTQFLALPIEVMLLSDEVAGIEQFRAQIEAVGFSFETARNTVSVTEMPMQIGTDAVVVMFENFADVIRNSTGSVGLSSEIIFEKALYQASCKAAIKAGRVYPEGYTEWLVGEIIAHPEVTYCPHGRPIAIEIEKGSLDRRFRRS